ncbi:FAD-dependent oxidoreductase [Streptomyces sp. OUCMDZ-4982]|uniref:FAD-binding oxidoreductase n=1 Tax=Streptomyces sp. OUCMDZ-4982 TaxID=2973090 RepID=UPI00215C7496|nr:FAD-dependent oxidoreductase [Streptomyces sp. OUCMDZ-4982]MCR8945137.1 FAD-dependent oxidoreductase [Streptomyces sp. OUCMDZ-4982]
MPTQQNGPIRHFPDTFGGALLHPGTPEYAASRSIFNQHTSHAVPALIARAADQPDVLALTRYAAESGTPLAVRAGGHGVDGYAMPDGALVVDLSELKTIELDTAAETVRLGAGVLLGEMDAALAARGLVVPAGTVSTTGVAGLTLGGGVGYHMRAYGATVDNLLSCEVATLDGRLVRASEHENPELFWALRGGGGNFGVVTSFEFRTRPVREAVTAGFIPFPLSHAREVLEGWRQFMTSAPRELSVIAAVTQCPRLPSVPEEYHDSEVVLLVMVHTGDPARAAPLTAALAALGPAITQAVQQVPWPKANSMLDAIAPPGRRSVTKGGYLSELTDEALEIILRHAAARPPIAAPGQPGTVQNIWAMGGAISEDFAEDSVAFSREGANWFWETVTQWDEPEDSPVHLAWADTLHTELKPHLRDNCYINLSTDLGPEWRRHAWGSPGKYERLQQAKAEWDPLNLLRFNKNIEPGPAT